MDITASTTEEQILKPIAYAKTRLYVAVTEATGNKHFRGEILVKAAQDVRNAEALADAQLRYHASTGLPVKIRLGVLFDLISNPDDSWSGRGNDSVRAASDVVRDWAKEQAQILRVEDIRTTARKGA